MNESKMKLGVPIGIAVVVIAVIAILALRGSGDDGNTSASAGGGSDETVKIGFVAPMSAPGDFRSARSYLETARMWIDDVNANGGIDGRQVELVMGDDQGKPEVGVSETTRVITEEDVSAIVGVWHSAVAVAQSKVAERYNVPMMVHYSWEDALTAENFPQVYRVGPYNTLVTELFLQFLRDQGYERVTILSDDTDIASAFGDEMEKMADGNPKIDVVRFQAETTDLTPQLSQVASNPPDAVIVNTVYAASYLAFPQAAEVGLDVPMIAQWDFPVLPDFWETVKGTGKGVIYPTFADETMTLTDEGLRFREIYEGEKDTRPSAFHYFLWDAMNAIKWAVEESGSSDPATLVETLKDADYEGTSGQITFTREPGTVRFNQWEGMTMFFKQMTEVNQTDEDAKVISSTAK